MRELVSRLVKFEAGHLRGHVSWRFWAAPEASLRHLGGPGGLLGASLWLLNGPGRLLGRLGGLLAALRGSLGAPAAPDLRAGSPGGT